ncbi:MAG: hypothetical protein JWO22_838 [Frankiales bacterium]|nr:hypothetical protein [Frankiales bacterium]
MTVSQCQPAAFARACTTEVLPVPGAPHSRTGTRAAVARESASTTICWESMSAVCRDSCESAPVLAQHPDPETALRIACERMLLSNIGPNRGSQPAESAGELASALVLLAGLAEDAAEQAVADYSTALSLRGVGTPLHFRALQRQHAQQQGSAAPPLFLPTVCVVDRRVQIGEDLTHVSTVTFGPASVEIVVGYDREPATFTRRHAALMSGAQPGQAHDLTVKDDRGVTGSAHFSGVGGGTEWHGRWTTQGPLSPTTAWLDIEGTRVELEHAMASCEVRVEERVGGPLVHEFLWDRLAASHHHQPEGHAVLELLADVGLLTEDDASFLDAYARVVAAMGHGRGPTKVKNAAVPAPWRSLLARRNTSGRVLFVPMAAMTPVFDGFQLVVSNLRGLHDGFEIDAAVRGPHGGVARSNPFEDDGCTNPLTWWADDDRGNSYLGAWNGRGMGPDSADGQIRFLPGLDRRATVVRLTPQSLKERAVVEVPLP